MLRDVRTDQGIRVAHFPPNSGTFLFPNSGAILQFNYFLNIYLYHNIK